MIQIKCIGRILCFLLLAARGWPVEFPVDRGARWVSRLVCPGVCRRGCPDARNLRGRRPLPGPAPPVLHILKSAKRAWLPGVAAGGEVRGASAALTRLLPLPLLFERHVAAPAATPVAAQLVVGLGDRSAVDSWTTAGTVALFGGADSAAVVAVVDGGEPLNAPVLEPRPRLRVLPSEQAAFAMAAAAGHCAAARVGSCSSRIYSGSLASLKRANLVRASSRSAWSRGQSARKRIPSADPARHCGQP